MKKILITVTRLDVTTEINKGSKNMYTSICLRGNRGKKKIYKILRPMNFAQHVR